MSKTISVPFESEEFYNNLLEDGQSFREYILDQYEKYPELFPEKFSEGFNFHGFTASKKIEGFRMRRILLKSNLNDSYQIRPSFVMPYMIEKTDAIEKALYLRRWGVPFDALAYVFGKNAMFWYRASLSIGRNSIVGTTVKKPESLPENVVSDEKHTWIKGEKTYAATTACNNCVLGSELSPSASTKDLEKAYGKFKEEAQNIDPEYAPKSVNTDGWEPTQNAWKKLFPTIVIVLCFLHGFLKIKDRCRRSKELFKKVGDKVWNVYYAETKAKFSQRLRRLKEWARKFCEDGPTKNAIENLCKNGSKYKPAYEIPGACRTSNAVDRLMNYQDRVLYAMQYFHGTDESANLHLRSIALLWNFHPYGTKTRKQNPGRSSPFHDLNGFSYHENWLQNMLVASSMGGWRQ